MWYRARFVVCAEDFRPVEFPPPGPYWCSGYDSEDCAILIAYVKSKRSITNFWPEAEDIEFDKVEDIVFTDRFPQPSWWPSGQTAK